MYIHKYFLPSTRCLHMMLHLAAGPGDAQAVMAGLHSPEPAGKAFAERSGRVKDY